jgi:hypothetical protein
MRAETRMRWVAMTTMMNLIEAVNSQLAGFCLGRLMKMMRKMRRSEEQTLVAYQIHPQLQCSVMKSQRFSSSGDDSGCTTQDQSRIQGLMKALMRKTRTRRGGERVIMQLMASLQTQKFDGCLMMTQKMKMEDAMKLNQLQLEMMVMMMMMIRNHFENVPVAVPSSDSMMVMMKVLDVVVAAEPELVVEG